MFSSPNITTGFGTLGSSTPSQSALGLPNPPVMPSNTFMSGSGSGGAGNMGMSLNAGMNMNANTGGGATSSPAFSLNTPASGPGGLMAFNTGSMSGTPGAMGMGMAPSNIPQMPLGGGMLSIPSFTGISMRASTPGGVSQAGTTRTAGGTGTGERDGQAGLSIDMALKGLDEAMAAVMRMEELLLIIKADQGKVFGKVGERDGEVGQGRGADAVGGEGDDVPAHAAAGEDEPMGGEAGGETGQGGSGVGMDGMELQRLQQTRNEYAQLQTALQHHLTSTTLGSLPLHPYLPSTSTSVPEPNPSDINADAPITTTHPDTTTTQRQAMGMPDLVAWAEKRAERDFERREGIRDTAKVVLDALRLR